MQSSNTDDTLVQVVKAIAEFDFHHRFSGDADEFMVGKEKEKVVKKQIGKVADPAMRKYLKACFYPGEQGKLKQQFPWV